MARTIGSNSGSGCKPARRKNRRRRNQHVQKANGTLGPRVQKVGAERFGIVCVDPAKERSEWMMADYFGKFLIEPRTLEHQAGQFKLAIETIQQVRQEHGIEDLIVTVERTGNYHISPQRAFRKAGFETRVIHPFATKQFRLPADPGNKTDPNDLAAQHRAAIAGFGLVEMELDDCYRFLRLRVRHRRNLVEKSTAIACQVRDHLHLAMPGYAGLFQDFFKHSAARAISRRCESPQAVLELGESEIRQYLREQDVRFQTRSLDKILAWASEASQQVPDADASLHRAIWSDLDELYERLRKQIHSTERELASLLVKTPYVRLLVIPGINVVSAADLAGEMGPITHYANANAITGRAGLYPSRYQSDETDHANGRIVKMANRRLRGALMRIADNLAKNNAHFRGRAELRRANGTDERSVKVRIANSFSRIGFVCVAGDEPMKHPCCAKQGSVIEKLRAFHKEHRTPLDVVLADLETAVGQLPVDTKKQEARIVTEVLNQQVKRGRGPKKLGDVLPAVLARLGVHQTTQEGSVPS